MKIAAFFMIISYKCYINARVYFTNVMCICTKYKQILTKTLTNAQYHTTYIEAKNFVWIQCCFVLKMKNLEKCLLNGNSISYQTLHGNIQFLLCNNSFEINSFLNTVLWGCYTWEKKFKAPKIALFWILEHCESWKRA